jgi:hypothetical protein
VRCLSWLIACRDATDGTCAKNSLDSLACSECIPTPVRGADSWEKRWKKSTWKTSEKADGTFKLTAGKWYGDANDKGIQTGPDARFFAYYSKLDTPYDNAGKDLVFQVCDLQMINHLCALFPLFTSSRSSSVLRTCWRV